MTLGHLRQQIIQQARLIFILKALSACFAFSRLQPLQAQPSGIDYPLRDAVAFRGRADLPNFFSKLAAGRETKIAYLGGSITEQPGWRVKSRNWFQTQFPKAKVEEINAAVGGTGSDLGVFRVDSDVLASKPDLLFVEFAVNDRGTPPANIRRAIEGIVRKTWKAQPDCDICFVYTVAKEDIEGLKVGKMKRSECVMEEVADHYGIPSIHLGVDVARLEQDGKLVMASLDACGEQTCADTFGAPAQLATDREAPVEFSKDGVHPYLDTGHALYAMSISRAMESIRWMGERGAHELVAPLTRDNWEGARMLALDQGGSLRGDVTKLDPAQNGLAAKFGPRVPALWEMKPGATLRFKFKGSKAAIYDVMGPDCGFVEVTLDGKTQKVMRFDSYSTYHRLSVLKVGDTLGNNYHEVDIKVLPEDLDKECLIPETRRKDLKENPGKYEGSNWYAGAILLVGESVK